MLPLSKPLITSAFLLALSANLLPLHADPAPVTLDAAKLKTLLDNMGYAYTVDSTGQCQITEKRNGFTIYILIAVGGDGTELWFRSYIGDFDPAAIPPSILAQMLKDNQTYSPAFFNLIPTASAPKCGLYLSRAVDNHDLTPALIRAAIETHLTAVLSTTSTWDSTKWPTATSAPAPAATAPAK